MPTLKVACPHCGRIDAFSALGGQSSFASLIAETCAICGHAVTFADVKDMRRKLAAAIALEDATVAVSAYALCDLSSQPVSRRQSRARLL
jgi:uncharacterized protein (DUF983 family)